MCKAVIVPSDRFARLRTITLMEKAQRRARSFTRWGIALAAVIVLGWPLSAAADDQGYFPAPPISIHIDGQPSRIWAASVTEDRYTSIGKRIVLGALLRYQWSTLHEHGPYGDIQDVVVRAALDSAGYPTGAQFGTPTRATGDSADLAIALSAIDAQTPGSLTGGVNVVATGELSPSGEVLPIDGVNAKVVGAQRAGFTVMLIPQGNSADLADQGRVSVAPVRTLRQAVRVLCSLGSDDSACR